jgi:hypothetical protein
MKIRKAFLFLAAGVATLGALQSCNQCKESGTVTFDATKQFLSIEYRDTAGRNYVDSIYNLSNVNVLINTNQGVGSYQPIIEDLTDHKIGPFAYTTTPEAAAKGVPYDYYYIVDKDTFKTDTFRIQFLATVDECHEYWAQIKYWKNGVLISECDGKEDCQLIITE